MPTRPYTYWARLRPTRATRRPLGAERSRPNRDLETGRSRACATLTYAQTSTYVYAAAACPTSSLSVMRAGAQEAPRRRARRGEGQRLPCGVCAAVIVVGQRASTSLRTPLARSRWVVRAYDVGATQQMSGGLFGSARCVANLRGPKPIDGRYCSVSQYALAGPTRYSRCSAGDVSVLIAWLVTEQGRVMLEIPSTARWPSGACHCQRIVKG